MNHPRGTYLATLQFFFMLTWVVYVIYLPGLAGQAGIDKRWVPWILMLDQAIFVVCDWAAGVYADRVASVFGRLGRQVAWVTAFSGAAFLAMPHVAPMGGAAGFLALTVFWSITSSALRAPPLVLLGRHMAQSRQPWLAAMYLLGLGVAAAIAPYLGGALKDVDPRVPFAAASAVLVLVTLGLAAAERDWVGTTSTLQEREWRFRTVPAIAVLAFALAVALFGFGFQVHFSVNSAPSYARLASADQLPKLMPVFWVGFNLAVLPASLLAKRFGGPLVMAAAGVAGVAALLACSRAMELDRLIVAQFAVGACWGAILMSAVSAGIAVGHPGKEGTITGMLFSMLAVAALARIGMVVGKVAEKPALAALAGDFPAMAWGLATIIIVLLATSGGAKRG